MTFHSRYRCGVEQILAVFDVAGQALRGVGHDDGDIELGRRAVQIDRAASRSVSVVI